MSFGERLTLSRKRRKLTQGELGKAVGTTGDMIGKYEREVITPTIEVAGRMAEVLNVSLDFLIRNINGESDNSKGLPPVLADKLQYIEKLSAGDQDHILSVIDAFIAKSKLESIIK
ncbi:transcriptional regulator with XRE-family HTH domain [Chitinophaga terrae (ex Kim and Jung 2007)]|uniref:helix-turn-helix domain-containing protein n=1 Tax=Chitinophaga terrae (ex Kim and Jung 2007) TaxID=408074 RepID=UPI00278AA420|nr:helix-turn-helix transcriptional regulator [Chitinophaga terrae (ex Kim and Jung 2007)]MDQ0108949.1 transcriptional regulator with XRE-family HTH domain [Chitinophaga terrae (ex Kim and Jung 2007)]